MGSADDGGEGFTDAGDLPGASAAEMAPMIASLLRADLLGADPGAVERSFAAASPGDRRALLLAYNRALADDDLASWIEADAARRSRAEGIVLAIAPPDPSPEHNQASAAAFDGFDGWDRFPYGLIIVPGYTPADTATATPGVHPIAQRRLDRGAQDLAGGSAPFLLVTGGNVYPEGTPYYEAVEMKKALLAMGVAEDRILVEARARHSTTNLRNAGRIMRTRGLAKALITTMGGGLLGMDLFDQDFYFSFPWLSTFNARCRKELGAEVGDLSSAGPNHTAFVPAESVLRVGLRDALDP
jgi:DUF218 domain